MVDISREVIGAAIEVHRNLGPGLLESTYEACLAYELRQRDFEVKQQVALPVHYRGVRLDCGYRIDLLVEKQPHYRTQGRRKIGTHSRGATAFLLEAVAP